MELPCLDSLKPRSYRAKLFSPETGKNQSAVTISAHRLDSDESMGAKSMHRSKLSQIGFENVYNPIE